MAIGKPDLMTKLRNELLDVVSPYLWSDAVLGNVIDHAVDEISYLFPLASLGFYDIAAGQQVVLLAPGGAGVAQPLGYATAEDLIAVLRVELPVGNPIPEDAWSSTFPAPSTSSRTTNGYRWFYAQLRLRNPASGLEVGSAALAVYLLQSYPTLDAGGLITWNGAQHDLSLLLMLAKRSAYQLLSEWQARSQGLTTPTIGSGSNVHIDVEPILAGLEVQIARAIELRQLRADRYAALLAGATSAPSGAKATGA